MGVVVWAVVTDACCVDAGNDGYDDHIGGEGLVVIDEKSCEW